MSKLNLKDALNQSLTKTKQYIDTELAKKANTHDHNYLPLTGGTATGNIVLYNSTNGDSPALIFQRGTTSDTYTDWRLQDRGGSLYFDKRVSDGSFSNAINFNENGAISATGGFNGNASSASKVNNNMIVKLNGGSTEGTNLFTFNGSTAKTVNITPSAIGAVSQTDFDAFNIGGRNYVTDSKKETSTTSTYMYRPLSPDAKTDLAGKVVTASFDLKLTTAGGNIYCYFRASGGGISPDSPKLGAGTTSYKRYSVTFTAPTDLSTAETFSVHISSASGTYYLKNLKLELGNRASSWCPAVEDALVLGETSTTAYRGDRGKTAYDHSQAAHAPSNAQKNSDITKAEIEAKLTGNITSHTHTTLDEENLAGKTLSLDDLKFSDGKTFVKYYYCNTDGGGSNITGRPNDNEKYSFNLKVELTRWSTSSDYIFKQTYTVGHLKQTYIRYCNSGTWSAWEKIYTSVQKPTPADIGAVATTGGNITGNLTLYNSSSGDTPGLVFQRGTTSDSYYDWKIHDSSGVLYFGVKTNSNSDFDKKISMSENGVVTATTFNGTATNSDKVGGYSLWVGTQAQYDAISSKSSTTIYIIS